MNKSLISLAAALALASPAFAEGDDPETPAPSPGEIVEKAAASDWVAIAPEDLMVMTLAPDAEGKPLEVVIQLMPAPFSQGWIENIKTLTRSGYYDGLSVIRVQDNYVTQWGDPSGDEEGAKPLPEGLKVMGEDEYVSTITGDDLLARTRYPDPYAGWTALLGGWPTGLRMQTSHTLEYQAWPTHCYGMVGVARGMSPNTGDGSSLYTVIGHAPRQLDRNIALAGRVIEGMEHLSSLPRGKGTLGFYEDAEADKRTSILSVRIASDMPSGEQPQFEYLSTESEIFADYADARANRRDPFFIVPAGGADICNIPVPIRRVKGE